MEALLVLRQAEDYLFPKRKFTVWERAIYYHLLRQTHVDGKSKIVTSIQEIAEGVGISEATSRDCVRSLHERGCIKIVERSRKGHIVEVLLPSEIEGVLPAPDPVRELDLAAIDFFAERRFLDALLAREHHRCFYCLRAIQRESCELDHLIPQANGRDHSYRNVVCACHECNTTKQSQPAADFIRSLYRKNILSQAELEQRLAAVAQLQAGAIVPDRLMVQQSL